MYDCMAADFRNEVHNIKQLFDRKLHAALQAVLLLTAAAGEPPGSPRKPPHTSSQSLSRLSSLQPAASHALPAPVASNLQAAAGAATAACAASGKGRTGDLEQHTQQQCVQLLQQLAEGLHQQLQQLQELPLGANSIEQLLVVARLCSAIADGSAILPSLLGPSSAWAAAAKAGPNASRGAMGGGSSGLPASIAQGISALGPAAAALLKMHHPDLMQQSGAHSAAGAQLTALQQQLHGTACAGFAVWAKWVASSLSVALLGALTSDELLHSDTTPLSWAQTTIAAEGADAAGSLLDPLDEAAASGDMIFSLPAVPSAAVLQMLSWACWVSEVLNAVPTVQLPQSARCCNVCIAWWLML